jgi:hypothetical protein
MQMKEFCNEHCSSTGSVINHHTDLPMGIIAPGFVAAFWLASMIHECNAIVSQNLSVFSFLSAKMESAGYKHLLKETNTAFGEQMVGETSSNTTKLSMDLFSTGKQSAYDDLKTTVANLHTGLMFMLNKKEWKSSRIINNIESLFNTIASPAFKHWFSWYATGNITWLCHLILINVHNVFCQMVLITSNPTCLNAIIAQEPINATDMLADLEMSFAMTIQKRNMTINQNSLSAYNLEPSTWRLFRQSSESQDLNKKPKPTKNKSQSHTNSGTGKVSNGGTNTSSNSSWGHFNNSSQVPRGSYPNLGMLEAVNQSALLTCLKVSNGKKACHNFIVKGCSCKHGQNCCFKHVTTRSDAANLSTLHRVVNTEGITWITPDPKMVVPPTPII